MSAAMSAMGGGSGVDEDEAFERAAEAETEARMATAEVSVAEKLRARVDEKLRACGRAAGVRARLSERAAAHVKATPANAEAGFIEAAGKGGKGTGTQLTEVVVEGARVPRGIV
jgi:hypothetical protein